MKLNVNFFISSQLHASFHDGDKPTLKKFGKEKYGGWIGLEIVITEKL